MKVEFRNAVESDFIHIKKFLGELHKIHCDARSDVYKECKNILTKEEYIEKLNNNKYRIIVASIKGKVVGYTLGKIIKVEENSVQNEDKYIYIEEIYTDTQHRKQGIAKGMLQMMKNICIEEKCKSIQLNVWSFNENAITLYYDMGFQNRNLRLEYYI